MIMEVFGELTDEGKGRVQALRQAFVTLLTKYNLRDKIDEQTYLLLGIIDGIPKETMQEWAGNEHNKRLQHRAKYFLEKK
jgi:hypothetical protein